MSPISMDCFRCFCAVLLFAASSRPAVVPAEDPAWSVISDGLLADLERAGKKPDRPGKTTGVAADRTTGEVFVLVPGQGVWRTAEGGVRFERVDGGKVGGRCETGWSIHTDPEGKRMARRYKDARAVWGYDLANEPVEEYVGDGCDDWHDLAERAARAVREIDARHAIIVEAPPWGSPESLADFEPLSVPGVVYSAHMYVPAAFTHQGVFRQTQRAYSYPGEIEGKRWDKAALEAALRPVLEFQQAYSVPIYIGEFSAIRWAPDDSACRYLRDAIEIFESHGWDWSYHAFREWDGWSVEHGEDRTRSEPSPVPTTRERLLREWFAQCEKPSW